MVEQSAEEALNSLVEEMKEILAAPVYNLTPLQRVSENFWLAMGEAKKSTAKKEERLEQALAKIKAEFLLAREEYEEQLSGEREKAESMKRRFNELRHHSDRDGNHQYHASPQKDRGALHLPYSPNRPQSQTSSGGGSGGTNNQNNHTNTSIHYNFAGMDDANLSQSSSRRNHRMGNSSSQSVVSLGSEFAQKAKSLVHLINCQGGQGNAAGKSDKSPKDELNFGRGMGGSPG